MREIDKNKNKTGVLQNNKEKKVKKKRKSRLEFFRGEIEGLIKKGVSIRSAWKIINADLPEYAKISYDGFYKYIKKL